jgi:amino acid transporter
MATPRIDIHDETRPELVRTLGLWASIGVVIGITIGSGIFRTPAGIATRVPDARWMIGVWLLGGVITMCGALSVAELAAAYPRTGGLYVYLREGWGRLVAFLFGWSQLIIIRASAIGGISLPFGEYLLRSFGVNPAEHELLARTIAAAAIVFAAVVNIRGASLGALVAGLSTMGKFGALAVLVLASFALGASHGATVDNLSSVAGPVQAGQFGLALILVLFAYDGFADLSFAGGEVKDPKRNLPRALVLGTIAITTIYVLTNVAYLYVSPIGKVATSRLIAADTMAAIVGRAGVTFISFVVMVSTFGSLNGSMLASPRIFFAMADDGLFFRTLAKVHPTYKTPYVAISLAAVLGILLVLARTYEQLADMFVTAIWPFYALSIAAIYRLRRTRPDLERPYKVAGYPVVPFVFIAGVTYLIVNALLNNTRDTAILFAVILAGVPVYYAFFRR